ncbi:MAG: T9SS type A sorting domain-containing protein [Flavobacteriales bacterium]|nr:T9SS type A sorting domain-containing protein [Flavobacteriales bacterium]
MKTAIIFTSLVLSFTCSVFAQSEIQLRIVGGPGADQGNTVLPVDNGTYVLGSTSSDGTGNVRGYVIFYNEDFQFAWSLLTPYDTPVEQVVDAWDISVDNSDEITILSQRLGSNGTYNLVVYIVENLGSEGQIISSNEFTHINNQLPVSAINWRGSRWAVGESEGDGFLVNINEPITGLSDFSYTTWGHPVRTETVESAKVYGDTLYVTGTTEIDGVKQSTIWAWGANGEPIWARIQPDTETYGDNFARDLAVNDEGLMLLYSFERATLPLGHGVISLTSENGTPGMPINTSGNIFVDGCKLDWYGDQLLKLAHIDFGLTSSTDMVITWLGSFGGYINSGILGTNFDEKPSDMKIDDQGRIWVLGSTKGFLNGAQSICLYRIDSLNVIPDVNSITPGLGIKNDPLFQNTVGILYSESISPSIYPNPALSSSVIQLTGVSSSELCSYKVFNTQGDICFVGSGVSIPAYNLSPGNYFISVTYGLSKIRSMIPVSVVD